MDPTRAAVALIQAGEELLLVRRAERPDDRWSGHMALPGGRYEDADRDLFQTVLRETLEETGIALSREALVASLEDLSPRSKTLPSVLVRPFVFRLDKKPKITLSDELTGFFWFELAALQRSACEATVD